MDIVYINKPGDDNEELRYSLRSLVNLPHDNVWIVGHCPAWVHNDVGRIELVPLENKWANQRQSARAACADARISQDFILFNDDHFVVAPLDDLPVWHLGRLGTLINRLAQRGQTDNDEWFYGLKQTRLQMREWGYKNPDAYEAHIPLRFNRRRLAWMLDHATRQPFLWGAAYSATGFATGRLGDNVKCIDGRELLENIMRGFPLLSTEDEFFTGPVGEFVRNMFPEPGPYEEAA
jgi:hypothetical protein